jgi:DNA-directed RNA polymerase specialized sigma24 family protein
VDQQEWLARQFEEQRPRLRAVAYRMLGSLSEADDAVQDAWLRLSRADASEVENLGGWLTTDVARVARVQRHRPNSSRAARHAELRGRFAPEADASESPAGAFLGVAREFGHDVLSNTPSRRLPVAKPNAKTSSETAREASRGLDRRAQEAERPRSICGSSAAPPCGE